VDSGPPPLVPVALGTLSGLTWRLARRDIESRYRGSGLGIFWAFVHPVVLLAVYTYVFGVLFQSQWPHAPQRGLGSFALTLFCGLIAFNILAECLARAPTLITSMPHYVKRVVFPLEVLPVSMVGSALFHGLVNVMVLLGASLLVHGGVPWTVVLLPLVCLPLVLLAVALAWLLACLGAFLRDLPQGMSLLTQVLLFGTPILYAEELLPPALRRLLVFNPLAWLVHNLRRVLLWGETPDWSGLAGWTAATAVLSLAACLWFMRVKRSFADVL
jgi:lipopolysaccharide transport system permease protein